MKKFNLQRICHLFTDGVGSSDLEVCRILFYLLIWIFFSSSTVVHYTPGLDSLYDPVAFHKWFSLPIPGPWIFSLEKVWHVFLLFSALGFLTRFSTLMSFILGFYILGIPWQLGRTSHKTQIIITCMGILALSRCGVRLSIDSWIKSWLRKFRSRDKTDAIMIETWPVRMCQLTWCLMFFNAGISKIKANAWGIDSGLHFQNTMLVTQHLWGTPNSLLRDFVYNSPQLGSFLINSVILLEATVLLSFIFVGPIRWFYILSLILMQIGAYYLLGMNFFMMFPVYLFWIPWTALLTKFRHLKPNLEIKT